MNTREQFGRYLLLKKLIEDPLGETFRAGKLGEQGMERVVLLRVFNGHGIDSAAFFQRIAGRERVHQVLRSPNVGSGVDMGQVRGIPYAAYDYISGKDLASLAQQAITQDLPVPTDHALLITERIALALAVGYETRLDGQRVLHGCVLPHLVMLSNEGETRLLGFEVAPAVREFVLRAAAARQLTYYLSPEARAGQPTSKSDDVFTLGVILLELLTGKPLPAVPDDDYGAVIDSAMLAEDETPVADELKGLLRRSLTTHEQRVGDVVTWHKTLSKLMFEGQYNPTTFNLAFFMHNLFRDDIERESQEIAVEKTMRLEIAPLAAEAREAEAAAAEAMQPVGEAAGVREDTLAVRQRYGLEGEKKSKLPVILGGAAAALIVVVGALYFLFGRGTSPSAEQELTQATAPEPVARAQEQTPPEPSGPSPEEIDAQIQQLVEERAKALETGLMQQYDARLRALQEELLAAQRAAAARAEAETAAATAVEETPIAEVEPEPTSDAAPTEAETPAGPESEPEAQPPARPAPSKPDEQPAAAEPPSKPVETAAKPAPRTQPPTATSVRTGDLVTPGPGVKLPKLLRRPQARFPAMARRIRKEGATVVVRVLVDETGQVADAQLKGEEVGFGFDREAFHVARNSVFEPATKDGVRVKIWVEQMIRFTM